MSKASDLGAAQWMGSAPWATFRRSLVTVGTAATPIPAVALPDRKGFYLFNASTVSIFLGNSTVGTSNEVIIFSNQGLFLPISDAVTLYGIVGSATASLVVWEYTAA